MMVGQTEERALHKPLMSFSSENVRERSENDLGDLGDYKYKLEKNTKMPQKGRFSALCIFIHQYTLAQKYAKKRVFFPSRSAPLQKVFSIQDDTL